MAWFSRLLPWNWDDEVKQEPKPAPPRPGAGGLLGRSPSSPPSPETLRRNPAGRYGGNNGNTGTVPAKKPVVAPAPVQDSSDQRGFLETVWDQFWEAAPWNQEFKTPAEVARGVNDRALRSEPDVQVPMPSDPTMLLLQRAGWETPEWAAGTGLKPADIGQDVSRRTKLDPYAYTVSPEEYQTARKAYMNAEGFVAPEQMEPDDPLRVVSRVVTSTPLPSEAYDLLSPAQKQAVDFNTMLLNSVKLDRAGIESSGEERVQYDRDVEELFGEGGGSDTYAPNIVRLLKNMDMDLRGQDLDEYLSLERGYTSDEIANLPAEGLSNYQRAVPNGNDYAAVRSFDNAIKMDRALIEEAGAFLDEAMADVSTRKWSRASTAAYGVTGAEAPVEEIPFGWEPLDAQGQSKRASEEDQNKEKIFQNALTFLADRANTDPSLFFQELDARGFTDADRQELFNFIGEKLNFMEQTGGPAYPFLQDSRTSEEIRQFVGLE